MEQSSTTITSTSSVTCAISASRQRDNVAEALRAEIIALTRGTCEDIGLPDLAKNLLLDGDQQMAALHREEVLPNKRQ